MTPRALAWFALNFWWDKRETVSDMMAWWISLIVQAKRNYKNKNKRNKHPTDSHWKSLWVGCFKHLSIQVQHVFPQMTRCHLGRGCWIISSVQFRPLADWVIRGTWGTIQQGSLPVFSAGGPYEQFWHGQLCPLFDVVHPAFPLLTTVLPTFQGDLKDGLGEAVTACDMPEPCKFLSLDSCQ